jgi:hypothetical protein
LQTTDFWNLDWYGSEGAGQYLSKIYQEVQLNPLLAWEPEYQFDFDDGDETSKVIGLG